MRTAEEIVRSIRASFVANTDLRQAYGLRGSQEFDSWFPTASLEAQLTYLVARAIYDHEYLMEERAAGIEARIASRIPFSYQWYEIKALEFQYGDELVFDAALNSFTWSMVNETKRIIRYVAVREVVEGRSTVLVIHVAKEDKKALSADELAAFKKYMTEIGAAGTYFRFVSEKPSELVIACTVYYDPLVLGPEGARLSTGGKPVEDAVSEYVDTIPCTGIFRASRCMDYIQQADGVLDVRMDTLEMAGSLQSDPFFRSPSGFFEAQVAVNYIATAEWTGDD
jgi:hypothetical protein